MPRRHPPIPRIWLMTDERMGDGLWAALERLPRGSGVVFRHYGLPADVRRALFRKVARIARKRMLVLIPAGKDRLAPGIRGRRPAPAHSRREAIAAIRAGADALFVSPVFATRSHPGVRPLGRVRFGLLVQGLGVPIIALGGMDARRARSLQGFHIHGWAGIDAWL